VTSVDKIHTIPNGIPADVFRAAGDLEKRPDKVRDEVLYVGQLIECKGVNVLLDAMQRLRRQRDVHLRLVYHNAQLEAELRRQARDLGLAEHVEFVGILGPRELAEEYHQADLLVLPSFAEGLPVVIMEAMALRRPVISTFVAGIPELVVPGEHGWLIPAGDVEALASAMQACLDARPDTIARMAEACHVRVLERHDVDAEANKLAKLFQHP